MDKISVIVAVYKMPEYLPRCVEGILNQTHRNLELILVDDGSPDHCGEICDGYAARDSRVKVIHKENAGVCVARNTGLDWVYENSDSQWIFFHDNDDWIPPQPLERLLDAAKTLDSKIAICGYGITEGGNPEIREEDLLPRKWSPKAFYMEHFVNATVCWGKLYHRDVFDGKRYPPGRYIEDEYLTYKLLFGCDYLAVIPAPLYAYYYNAAGISKKTWVPKRLEAWEAYEQQLAFFSQMGDEDLLKFRYRSYIDSGKQQLEAAQSAPNAGELTPVIRKMKRQLRGVVRRAWKKGYIDFWYDYDFLEELAPVQAKLYRAWMEKSR